MARARKNLNPIFSAFLHAGGDRQAFRRLLADH
jgi:hypothetical protein